MRLLLPSMPELHAFVAVARAGSISTSAQSLGMTQGGVSRCIRRLESRLGVMLFVRRGYGVTLTDAGRRLFDRIDPALHRLHEAMVHIGSDASTRSRLIINAASTLATRWLIPKLPEFNALVPNVRVVLQPYMPASDFLDPQTDCWIVPPPANGGTWPPHILSEYLAGKHIVPICHPKLTARLRTPEDLLEHPLLHHLEQPDNWKEWIHAQGCAQPFSLDSGFSTVADIIDAVAEGFGVGIVPRCLLEGDLRARRVALPFPRPVSTNGGYFICTPKARADDPVLEKFSRWLLRRARKDLKGT